MSETNGQPLPPGWAQAELGAISQILMGQSPPSSTYNSTGQGLPFFQGKAEFGILYPDARVWCSAPAKIAEQDDILLSVRAPVGPTNLAPSRSCIGRGLAALRPETGIHLKYLLHAFRRFAAELDSKGTGTTFKAVSGKVVRTFPVPFAPTTEQSRIADVLDELLSDLDAGVAALERVQAKLKHYRAAVLKAATEGALSVEWREKHPATEPATTLLTRILAERRRRWEETQLQKLKVAGKEPPKDWKAKYREPVKPDTTKLPTLPEGWCWASIDQLCSEVRNGYSRKPNADSGVPILRISSVRQLALNLGDMRYLSGAAEDYEGFLVKEHDLLFTRYNGTPSLVGVCAVVPAITRATVHPDKLIRCRPLLGFYSPNYAAIASNVGWSRAFLSRRIRTTAGQAGVSGSDIKETPLPLPPLAEQDAIAESVEDQLSVIDHLKADLEAKLKGAQALRQSILRHAFTGQLISQDPNDEPAAELLKRIAADRAERACQAAAGNSRARSANPPRRQAASA